MNSNSEITVIVQSGRGSVELTLPPQTKVQQVISLATQELGYPPNGQYVLVRQLTNEELDPNRPLVSYQIEDGEILILSEIGSGV